MKRLTIAILTLLTLTLTGCEDNKPQQQIDAEIAIHIPELYRESLCTLLRQYNFDNVNPEYKVLDPEAENSNITIR